MIGAAVVLYKPDMRQTERLLHSAFKQFDVVSIIDNSPEVTKIDLEFDNIHYHHFSNNIGVAAAHNIGLRDLITVGCEFAMLLDQDSEINETFAFRLSSLLVASRQQNRPLIAVGPRIICSFSEKTIRPRIQREISRYEDLVCVTQIISSGMMIDLSKISYTGLKDESLFIDGVDHEWCWRARDRNFLVAIADKVEMVHRLGDSRSKFAGVTYKVGSPVRLYYQFRNILLLLRRGYVPNYWKVRNVCVLPIRFLANSLLQERRLERIKFMLCGIWDGLLGATGAYSDNWK
ncbi:glycosyltransferase family 2 protein [Alteromonas oceanisediminis]|uniref:glycosyltransferase family 2 protein n=1 Tax=Alteromonas oceanisediminis TaxID=2836180 RepID=UPI001BD914C5|nr:glycosyltransferase family 2 protein [Alteromonas oceanisediminis]MBT0585057.1 glycosyltransferase family 2 protein [Alteromonas oceanisediminis]